MEPTQNTEQELTPEQQQALIGFTTFFAKIKRTQVLRTPAEYGMEYEDVSFPALDGLTIKGWFIPADSDKLIIVNHFMTGSRYGYPGHLEPNDPVGYEVNYLPQHKVLHDAGYNILAYDLRNHGESDGYNNGCGGSGQYEYRDVIGSIRYARSRKDTANMKIGLYSICYGCNSTLVAINKHPEEFARIETLLALQPASAGSLLERFMENLNINKEAGMALADKTMLDLAGFHIEQLSPIEAAKSVTLPTLVVQVHRDSMSHAEDVQSIYDNIPAKDKKLFWIEGTTDRFRGYTYFNDKPELLLQWFNEHMGWLN